MGQFGAIASIAAFTRGGHWLDGVLGSLDDNRRLLADLIADELPGVRYRMPDATYLAWLDLRPWAGATTPPRTRSSTRRSRSASAPSSARPVGRGHVRLNFACTPEVLDEAVTRLAEAR